MDVLVKTPSEMFPLLKQKSVENIFFKKYLRAVSSKTVDELVHNLNKKIEPQINCLKCANCCKKLEPGLENAEIEQLASSLNQDAVLFKRQHVAFDGNELFLKAKPCLFLTNCTCTIYEKRPMACAGFPHLNTADIKYRRSFWENYAVCPIVFNVMEALKNKLNFNHGA